MPWHDARFNVAQPASRATTRRAVCALLLVCACVATLIATPEARASEQCGDTTVERSSAPQDRERTVDQAHAATLLFMPGPLRTPRPAMSADLQRLGGFSVALFSPTLGRFSPTQMMLDISQGSRVATGLYRPVTPRPPGLVSTDSGRAYFVGWRNLVRRADAVPGEIIPGLLGCTLAESNKRVTWLSARGESTLSGIVAADRLGELARVELPDEPELANSLTAAQKNSDLVVAQLPAGGLGYGIARRLAAQQPERLVIVTQAPPNPARTRLLTIGISGLGEQRGLRSDSTRRNGLVAATDIAPTILQRMRVEVPSEMQGSPIETAKRIDAAELNELSDRLSVIASRREPLIKSAAWIAGLFLVFLLLAGRVVGRYKETARLAQRVVALAALWLPFFLLVAAVMRPSRMVETDIAVFGSLLAAYATEKLIRWPRAPWLPAIAVLLAHGVDFVLLDGQLTGESLLGSNPLYGARFFGVGNELEAVLTVSAVVGVGAALCGGRSSRPSVWFGVAGALLIFYLGAGQIGADVGGVIYAAAAFGAAALYVAKVRVTVLRALVAALIPVAALVVIGLLDAASSGESHLTRTVFEAQSPGELWDVVERRFKASYEGARDGAVWRAMIVAFALLAWGLFRRDRLCARLTEAGEDPSTNRPYRAGLVGALVGTVVGAVANDSGPAILIIGTIYLGMAVLYMHGRPPESIVER